MMKPGENRKVTDRVRKYRWRQSKDNVPQAVVMQYLRDAFPCLLDIRITSYNCDVQFGQRLALRGMVL
jgi:hypothetical protein